MSLSVPSLAAVATVLGLLPAVRAAYVDDISIASIVKAGEATSVDITQGQPSDDDDDEGGYPGIRVYLAAAAPGWDTNSLCYLVNHTDAAQVDVTVPAAVAPAGSDLALAYSTYLSDYGTAYGYSDNFTLEGAAGTWTAMERNGYTIALPDYHPCTAIQCARDCSDEYYPTGEPLLDDEGDYDEDLYMAWYGCLSSCPGTSYPTAEEMDGDDDGDDDNDDDGEDDIGLQTSTKTAASATATSASTDTASSSASGTTSTSTSTSTAEAGSSGASRTALTTTALLVSCLGVVSLLL